MQTRNLETLLCVVRLGGVSAAARHLNLTQPTISRRIDELERELGTPLFRREGRQVVPTPAARLCLAGAERIVAEVGAMRELASGRGAARRTIRIGVAELVALTWFERLLSRLGQAHPHLVVDLRVNLASQLVDGLARRQLDLALIPGEVPIAGVVKRDIGACQYLWMGTRAHLQDRAALSPHEAAELPVMMSAQGSDTHLLTMRWFEAAGAVPSRLSLCNNLSVLGALVRKGLGVAPLPLDLHAEALASGALVALPGRPAMRPVAYSACYLPSADAALMQEIAELAQEESWFTGDRGNRDLA